MKIILINPPTANVMRTNEGFYSLSSVNATPPVNLMYPATTLKQRTNHIVKIMDADIEKKDYFMIEKEMRDERPDVVGVTLYTVCFYDGLETIKAVKRAVPHAKICVGGNLTKYFPKELLEFHPEIDFVMLGDAEYSFPELVNALENNISFMEVKGILYRNEQGQIIQTGPPNVIKNIDELPFPDLTLIQHMKYRLSTGTGEPAAVIIGSRGCPFQCGFCQSANTGYRMRSIQSMLDEVKYYLDHGITEVTFFDDTFNITPKRVIDFSNGLLDRGYKIKWSIRGRIELVNEEMFRVAKEAGLNLMSFGVEDATDEGLLYMKRGNTLKQVSEGVALAKKYDIPISANFIIGLPQHKTEDDIVRVIKLAKKLDPTYCQISIYIPHLGTRLYKEGIEKGILSPTFWLEHIKNPKKESYIEYWEEHLTQKQIRVLMKKAYLSFYFDPRYIIKTICQIRTVPEFVARAKVGYGLFKRFIVGSGVGRPIEIEHIE